MVLQVASQPTVILFSRRPPVEPAAIVRRRRQMKIHSRSSGSSMQEMDVEKMDEEITNWVDATSRFFQEDTRPIMLFDGVCNLCNGGVHSSSNYQLFAAAPEVSDIKTRTSQRTSTSELQVYFSNQTVVQHIRNKKNHH